MQQTVPMTQTRPSTPLNRGWNPASLIFLGLSIIGLVGTLIYNVTTVIEGRDFFGDLGSGGPAVGSLGVDLLVVAVAGSVLIVVEARRLRMKRAWLYIVLSLITAIAFTFPLFLAMRERRLLELSTP